MITRQIGKILRGKATPLQILMAAILGAMLGFVPGWWEGPGLIIALTLLLIVLNANLAVAAIVGLLAKLVSYALLPVTFEAGRFLLDGPTQNLFKVLINAPGTALFGLEHYLTTGGVAVGFIFGLICGIAINAVVKSFRTKMSTLEEGSERYHKWAGKKSVKLLTFIFIGGGKGKKTYAELLEKKAGNPIRVLGVIFAALLVALLWIAQAYFSGPILTMSLRDGLERANGATVDLGNAEVDLRGGKMVISNLAMADPNALNTDLLRATTVEADISSTDLLRKRARLDRVVVRDATSGDQRRTPGRLVGPAPEPSPPVDPTPDEQSLEDIFADAKVWKDRLAQLREWLEKLGGAEDEAQTPQQKQETLEERIKRQIRESGYASVKASHLIEGAPTFVVTELIADGVKSAKLEGEVLDIRAKNLSTHPRLLAASPSVSVKSKSGKIVFNARMGETGGEEEKNRLRFTYQGLPVDSVSKSLKFAGTAPPIAGGTMDLDVRGNWTSAGVGNLNLPLRVTLHDTMITIPQAGSQHVNQMQMAFGVRGPMDNPKIEVDKKQMADALKAAGADALASHVRGEADKKIAEAKDKAAKEITGKIDEELGGKLNEVVGDKSKGLLGEILPGAKKSN